VLIRPGIVMSMRTPLILAAIIGFSASALAQTATPNTRGKLKGAKPVAPMGCKLVSLIKGTKLWAGDCVVPSELRGTRAAYPRSKSPSCKRIEVASESCGFYALKGTYLFQVSYSRFLIERKRT
jgi:hypothetical protein